MSRTVPDTRWIKNLSYLLDEQFRFPGTNFRFGLDPIINLIPAVGDIAGFAISSILLFHIARKGASGKLIALMVLNILLDATIGAIPVIGQIFDFFFKANSRNIRLMQEYYFDGKHQGSGKGVLIFTALAILLFLGLLFWGILQIIRWTAQIL